MADLLAAVREALGADEATEAEIEGGVRLELARGDCVAKLDVYGDHVHWVSLRSPGEQHWVADAHEMARDVFPRFGLEYVLAAGLDDEARSILEAHGPWEETGDHGRLRWDL